MGAAARRIQLTADDTARAEAYARKSLLSTVNRRGVSDAERQRDIRVGKLGELAFLRYLLKKGKASLGTELMFVNTPDAQDFTTGSGETIDVKTASQPYHHRVLVPKDQLDDDPKDYYVGVRVNEDTLIAIVEGYATRSDLASGGAQMRQGYTYPAYDLEIRNLRPIKALLELIPDKGEGGPP